VVVLNVLSAPTCVAGDLGQSPCYRDFTWRACDSCGIIGRFFEPGIEIGSHLFRRTQLLTASSAERGTVLHSSCGSARL